MLIANILEFDRCCPYHYHTSLLYVDLGGGNRRLGGTALATVHSQVRVRVKGILVLILLILSILAIHPNPYPYPYPYN